MSDIRRLPVLSLTDAVVLPGMVVPIELDEPAQAAIDAARAAAASGDDSADRDDRADGDDRDDSIGELLIAPRLQDRYAAYGVVATIEQVGRMAGGAPAAVLRAHRRARIGTGVSGPGAALWVQAEIVDDEPVTDRAKELAAEYKSLVIANLQKRDAWQVIDTVEKMTDPSDLADASGWAPYLTAEQKRQVLETPQVEGRLELLIDWTRAQLAEMDVAEKIGKDVRDGMEKNQREFLLRQQLAAIRKELGEGEPDGADDFRTRVEQADLPDKVREAALREVGRLERASDQSPESGWIRTWLDTVLEIPWQSSTEDKTDVSAAREVLDADHHGLGDVRDEAEIRGHRRTYVGALPGRIVRAVTEAGSMNPVMLLDEIDKVGADYRGDPAAALLEVLDPAQNHTFRDHYLDIDLDLSDVLFLATANVLDTIPSALLDRMELITMDGYTEEDKVAIARTHLLPRQVERAALTPDEVEVTDAALHKMAADYTREAGVRQLERLLALS